MKIVQSSHDTIKELPLKLHISFEKVLELFKKYANKEFENHPFHSTSIKIIEEIEKYPVLIDGFSDFSLLEKYKTQIDLLLEPPFPRNIIKQ